MASQDHGIHLRNLCQKEVITFNRLWEEEEAWIIIREEKTGAIEDQSHHRKKTPQVMRNTKDSTLEETLIHLNIWIRNDEAEGSRRCLPTKQIKISIQFSFHDIVFVMHLFIFSWCIMHDRMFALMTVYY